MKKIIKKLNKVREQRKVRSRAKIFGTEDIPRLSVFISNRKIYIQLIDDNKGKTIASSSSHDIKGIGKSIEAAKKLGKEMTDKINKLKIERIVFDRGGKKFHGIVKTIADTIKEGGINI